MKRTPIPYTLFTLLVLVTACNGVKNNDTLDAGDSDHPSDVGDSSSDEPPDTGTDTDTDADGDADTDADGDADTDADGDADTDTDGDADTDADTDVDTDADSHTDSDINTVDGYSETDSDTITDGADVLLDIPSRKQWTNDGGYCGCCSIQQIALYYGTYVSQDACRNTVDNQEVLVAVNEDEVLDALSFEYEQWDYSQPTPQYQDYLVWIEQHLSAGSPVIITVYMQGLRDADYDHIIPAIGFNSVDTTAYHPSDELVFNDCFSPTSFTRTFDSLFDTREMDGNGASYEYCIPEDRNYGCAVTGIKDDENITKPVHISIDSWNEPNVTIGETPETITMEIAVSGLTVGASYILLRYNDYRNVPSRDFDETDADASIHFTAEDETQVFTDTVMSDEVAVFRCI